MGFCLNHAWLSQAKVSLRIRCPKDADGRSGSRLSPENAGCKDETGGKIRKGTDGIDEPDKVRDAICKSGDGMELEDEIEKWGLQMETARWSLVSALKLHKYTA